ncbi:MAG: hypothetical protein KAU99_03495 [Thermoplasmata archaeon]|nr:hypothetical protein [Thermoplasmata archaeon]
MGLRENSPLRSKKPRILVEIEDLELEIGELRKTQAKLEKKQITEYKTSVNSLRTET